MAGKRGHAEKLTHVRKIILRLMAASGPVTFDSVAESVYPPLGAEASQRAEKCRRDNAARTISMARKTLEAERPELEMATWREDGKWWIAVRRRRHGPVADAATEAAGRLASVLTVLEEQARNPEIWVALPVSEREEFLMRELRRVHAAAGV